MKHKHYNEIVAWAEGKKIQVKTPSGSWSDMGWTPVWSEDDEYRIKPEPRTIWVNEYDCGDEKYLGATWTDKRNADSMVCMEPDYDDGDEFIRTIKFVEVTDESI